MDEAEKLNAKEFIQQVEKEETEKILIKLRKMVEDKKMTQREIELATQWFMEGMNLRTNVVTKTIDEAMKRYGIDLLNKEKHKN